MPPKKIQLEERQSAEPGGSKKRGRPSMNNAQDPVASTFLHVLSFEQPCGRQTRSQAGNATPATLTVSATPATLATPATPATPSLPVSRRTAEAISNPKRRRATAAGFEEMEIEMDRALPDPGDAPSLCDIESFPSLMVDMVGTDVPGTEEERDMAIQREATAFNDTMTKDGTSSATNTQNNYRTWLSQWKLFCQHADCESATHRYDVKPNKALVFFKEVVFKRKTIKFFHPSELKPQKTPISLRDEVPSGAAYLRPASDNNLGRMRRNDDARHKSQATPEDNDTEELLESCARGVHPVRLLDLRGLLDSLPMDKKGCKRIACPLSFESVDQAQKALVYLQVRQSQRLQAPNLSKHLRKSPVIRLLFDGYRQELVYGELRAGKDTIESCPFRNSYTIQDHFRMLGDSWRALGQTPLLLALREHFTLAVRHSMLLRDEDMRRLDQSDCFMDEVRDPHGGAQTISMLVFSIHKGKTNPDRRTQYGTAVRHKDVRRCSVGAMAFYFFERWTDFNGDPTLPGAIPAFDNDWCDHKVLHAGGKESNRKISCTTTRDSTYKVLRRQKVYCAHVTHSGRHSGALEGLRMGIAVSDIGIAGRWVQETVKTQQSYLSNFPMFALGMAGHLDKPFHLKRNEVWPSVQLQRQIFPFIEDVLFPPGTGEHTRWVGECMDAMVDKNPNRSEDLSEVESYQGMGGKPKGGDNGYQKRAQRSFLLMLVHMRRVILQDAAAYIALYDAMKEAKPEMTATMVEHNPVLARDVFSTEEFNTFKNEVSLAMQTTDVPPPTMNPAVVQTFKSLGANVNDLQRHLLQVQQSQQSSSSTLMQYAGWLEQQQLELRQELQRISAVLAAQTPHHHYPHCPHYPQGAPHYPPHPPHPLHSPFSSYQAPYPAPYQIPYPIPYTAPSSHHPPPHQHCHHPAQPSPAQQTRASAPPVLPRPPASHTANHPIRPLPTANATPTSRRQSPSILLDRPSFHPVGSSSTPLSLSSYLSGSLRQTTQPSQPPIHRATERPSKAGFKVRMEKAHGNFCLTVQQIWDEHQEYQKYRAVHGEATMLGEKEKKQLNNRKRIIEELEAMVQGDPPARTIEEAIRDLEKVRQENDFDAINKLVVYCREQKNKRMNNGRAPATTIAIEAEDREEQE